MNTSNPSNDTNSILQAAFISNSHVSQMLLTTVDPLVDKITPYIKAVVANYFIYMRQQLYSGGELLTVREVGRKLGVPVSTLYVWVNKGLISHFSIRGRTLLSTSEVRFVRQHIYQPNKATKKAGGRRGGL